MGGGWAGVLLPHLDTSLIQFVHTCVCLCVGGRGIHWLSQCIQLPVATTNSRKTPLLLLQSIRTKFPMVCLGLLRFLHHQINMLQSLPKWALFLFFTELVHCKRIFCVLLRQIFSESRFLLMKTVLEPKVLLSSFSYKLRSVTGSRFNSTALF